MPISFSPPGAVATDAVHHASAAAGNVEATTNAIAVLNAVLDGTSPYQRILLRAAAGAGKSYALRRMVEDALAHPRSTRVGVTAFANKQVFPLAEALGSALGRDKVCLYVSKEKLGSIADSLLAAATVTSDYRLIPETTEVLLGTSHMLGYTARYLRARFGVDIGEPLFDVLFVDEAWQLPLHRYRTVERLAPLVVGVGDVGQLPPLDPGQNPWRGDPGYNPYRAWPTAYETNAETWVTDLPAVWRPTAAQLPLWRAFYGDWDRLDCVAAPGDRSLTLPGVDSESGDVWAQVATGVPTLLEVDGLADSEAADLDQPLLAVLEDLLADLLADGFEVHEKRYDAAGSPESDVTISLSQPVGDPLIAVLATRNQAVDDAAEIVARLTARFDLPAGVIVASTVDSWQGQTNRITVAIHPLSGAFELDEFNSAFGRLAVTATRATHGLLMLARAGLDDLLATAPARPGTPLGEPGTRQLPRQTHQRILECFARGTLEVSATDSCLTSGVWFSGSHLGSGIRPTSPQNLDCTPIGFEDEWSPTAGTTTDRVQDLSQRRSAAVATYRAHRAQRQR